MEGRWRARWSAKRRWSFLKRERLTCTHRAAASACINSLAL
jgi:hypothetical protein